MSEPGPTSDGGTPGVQDRVLTARYVLVAAVAVVVAGVLFFELPLPFALASVALLVVVAALPFRSRVAQARREARHAGLQVWPDTSMKATVEALPRPAFVLDSAGVVRYANQQAAGVFPATRAGDPFTNTFRRPEFADAVGDTAAGQPTTVEFREPGASKSYLAHLSPLRTPGGGVGFILVLFDDVSDRLAIARMRADFVANASHELRTPLASLTGFIETLLGRAKNDPETQEKFLHIMMEQAQRMRRLTDDLLLLSRAEMRVHSRPSDMVELGAVLHQVADAMRPVAAESSVVISVDAPKDVPVKVVGDHDELVQVVQNLVENAIRYGGSGGKVDIRLELKQSGPRPRAAIHVQDYGPGIPAEHIPRLTERFYRVDVGASREMKGTGLGLAIVKHIITRHGGELDVKSQPGEGACFTVLLPLSQNSTALEEKTAENPDS